MISTFFGFLFIGLIILILFLEFRDVFLSKRIKAKVIRLIESKTIDVDGHERIDRFPEIQFLDPSGILITHELALTNMTWKKPNDTMVIYYRPAKKGRGYKICSPFMWPKMILLAFLFFGAFLLLFIL